MEKRKRILVRDKSPTEKLNAQQDKYRTNKYIQELFKLIRGKAFVEKSINEDSAHGQTVVARLRFIVDDRMMDFRVESSTTYKGISEFLLEYDPSRLCVAEGKMGGLRLGLDGKCIDKFYVYKE